jgi:FtsZ-binding cell division protein ZapB
MEPSARGKNMHSSSPKVRELLETIHHLQNQVENLEMENLKLKRPKIPQDQKKLIDRLSKENSKLREELQKHRGTVDEIIGPYKQEIKGLSAKLETYKTQLQHYMNVLLYDVDGGGTKEDGIGFNRLQRKKK